jgi:beta-D-xylosidase 4
MRMMQRICLLAAVAVAGAVAFSVPSGQGCLPGGPATSLPFCNTSLPVPVRVADLIGRLVSAQVAS